MDRPAYLNSYKFNWDSLDIMASGTSALDANNYLSNLHSKEEALKFLKGYGYDLSDPIQNAEMFGHFQEALQFIKNYFLKEGNEDGLDLVVPNIFYSLTDVSDLILILTRSSERETTEEDSIWAGIIMKVIHTVLHLDKDLRYRYFTTIQTQILDRFYKYLHREGEQLYLESDDKKNKIPLVEFETKSKKTRESTIIKLLHKKEYVAEELFDRIGIRFVTYSKADCLRVLNFLDVNYLIMVSNTKPSRSQNSLVNLDLLRPEHKALMKKTIKSLIPEDEFKTEIEDLVDRCYEENIEHKNNFHSSKDYKAIHFTCRQLIKYKNPFYQNFNKLRSFAKRNDPNNEITKQILDLDTTSIAKDIRFFYPFEVQVTDKDSHENNSEGEASHVEYKKSQIHSAMKRLFRPLIHYKKLVL